MMDRLPIEQYMAHQGRMSAAVCNIRQQALANINSYLMQGKPVFLHPENPTYRYYLDQGIQLGSTLDFSRKEVLRLSENGGKPSTNAAARQRSVVQRELPPALFLRGSHGTRTVLLHFSFQRAGAPT